MRGKRGRKESWKIDRTKIIKLMIIITIIIIVAVVVAVVVAVAVAVVVAVVVAVQATTVRGEGGAPKPMEAWSHLERTSPKR